MKAFLFDPLWDELITDELKIKLKNSNIDLKVTSTIAPLQKCKDLFEGSEDRILCINPDYVNWTLKSEDYEKIPRLKAILGAATSFSWIDTKFADNQNIPVCNIKNFSTQAVAEWAITIMFNLARQIPCLIKEAFPLDYDKDFMKYRGLELKGKTAGIIGLGNIGSAIAERCRGLGMNVVYWSKSPKNTPYEYVDINNLFEVSDVIFPALAMNNDTKNLITPELLKKMKKTTLFISIVHDMFDESLILDMVKKKELFGYGFEATPASFNKYDGNVWAAPAYAWATDGSMNNAMAKWVDNILNAAIGKFPNRVN